MRHRSKKKKYSKPKYESPRYEIPTLRKVTEVHGDTNACGITDMSTAAADSTAT